MRPNLSPRRWTATLLLAVLPVAAAADLRVTFRDGAPVDTFTITNQGACLTGPLSLLIDMAPSAGGLILDVTAAGAGVEVFQPLTITAGRDLVAQVPDVADGQTALALDLLALPPGARVAFTLDLDDTRGGREITVTGSEMQGSLLRVRAGAAETSAVFDADATAVLSACMG